MTFFIDSAITDDIEFALDKLQVVEPRVLGFFGGITTNPNAMSKAGVTSFREMKTHLLNLDAFLQEKRLNKSHQWNQLEIHVQLPISTMSSGAAAEFIRSILDLQLRSSVIFKFPPNLHLLSRIPSRLDIAVNITGLTSVQDCELMFMSPKVKYSSLIIGRMEEAGIDATSHLRRCKEYSMFRYNNDIKQTRRIITGSMRTPKQVIAATHASTIPTIGRKVWDLMTEEDCKLFADQFLSPITVVFPSNRLLPISIDDRNIKLTNDFFEQMDAFGQPIFDTFVGDKIMEYTTKLYGR